MKEIAEILEEFKFKCLNYRAFFDCELLDVLKKQIKDIECIFREGTITYRARAYKDPQYSPYARFLLYTHPAEEKDLEENPNEDIRLGEYIGFCGYNAKESFVNPNIYSVEEGRCNYKYSPCLYTAESVCVAISEIKPLIHEVISVAKIKNKFDLKFVDLRLKKENEFINSVAKFFVQSPTLENPEAYIYSQAICAFVKSLGYDGIVYSSCQVFNGVNYAIFNYDKCEAISSALHNVDNIRIFSRKM